MVQIVQLFRCLPYFTVIQSNKSVPFKPDAYCQKQLNMDTGKYLYFNVVVFLFLFCLHIYRHLCNVKYGARHEAMNFGGQEVIGHTRSTLQLEA